MRPTQAFPYTWPTEQQKHDKLLRKIRPFLFKRPLKPNVLKTILTEFTYPTRKVSSIECGKFSPINAYLLSDSQSRTERQS
jgi:hypothetical protein